MDLSINHLSKAFDTLNHDLVIAKLHAYGFSNESLNYISSYLKHRSQRTKVNSTYSSWDYISAGVPQGSILGPLLFNIFINDIFFHVQSSSLCNYADDNTLYAADKSLEKVKNHLHKDFSKLVSWFYENFMALNPDKCQFMCLGPNINVEKEVFRYKDIKLKCVKETKILGVIIDYKLKFESHIESLCKTVSQKLNCLARVAQFLNQAQKLLLFNSFIQGQFNYCPLVWMFCSCQSNSLINKVYERALRLAYNDFITPTDNLYSKYNKETIHTRNIQFLMTEVYKSINGLSPPILEDMFSQRTNEYNVRNFREILSQGGSSVRYGTETLQFRAPQLWQSVPLDIKNSNNLATFKNRIKQWRPDSCPCRLCKRYVPNLGFI